MRRVITGLDDGHAVSPFDQGAKIEVDVRVDRQRREVVIDFSGTGEQQPGSLDAPEPVTRAAVLSVTASPA